jgi:hypothetical protein
VQQPATKSHRELEDLDTVRGLVEQHIARNKLLIPTLPTVAVSVVRSGTKNSGDAHLLSDIIHTDPSLAKYVLSIASSAAKRPSMPITSLQGSMMWPTLRLPWPCREKCCTLRVNIARRAGCGVIRWPARCGRAS